MLLKEKGKEKWIQEAEKERLEMKRKPRMGMGIAWLWCRMLPLMEADMGL